MSDFLRADESDILEAIWSTLRTTHTEPLWTDLVVCLLLLPSCSSVFSASCLRSSPVWSQFFLGTSSCISRPSLTLDALRGTPVLLSHLSILNYSGTRNKSPRAQEPSLADRLIHVNTLRVAANRLGQHCETARTSQQSDGGKPTLSNLARNVGVSFSWLKTPKMRKGSDNLFLGEFRTWISTTDMRS